MPVFGFLDTLPIRVWDEARIANNALEMLWNKNYIVTFYEDHPDMWNTKPPLLIWTQVFFMKFIGTNEISVRLPSAIAAFFTCIVILIISVRYLKKFWFGFISVIILVTTQGYINHHAARTGDYDAMLTFFTTASCLLFFTYCETKQIKWLYLFFLSITFGILTKGVAGLLFTPVYIVYALSQKQLIPLLKNKHFYFGMIPVFVFGIGYYFLRDSQNPGYISAIFDNELGGRFLVSQGDQDGKDDFWFYLKNYFGFDPVYHSILIPVGLIIGLFSKDQRQKKFTLFLLLSIVLFYIVISLSKTKLAWYDIPLHPFLSMMIANFVYFIFEFIKNIYIFKFIFFLAKVV